MDYNKVYLPRFYERKMPGTIYYLGGLSREDLAGRVREVPYVVINVPPIGFIHDPREHDGIGQLLNLHLRRLGDGHLEVHVGLAPEAYDNLLKDMLSGNGGLDSLKGKRVMLLYDKDKMHGKPVALRVPGRIEPRLVLTEMGVAVERAYNYLRHGKFEL